MFAVPFQAFAATAMAFCGPGHGGAMGAASAGAAIAEPAVHADGHADHRHAHTAAAHDATHDAKTPAPGSADIASTAHAEPDTMHKCGACAACHAAALIGTLELAVFQGLPRADLAGPPNAVATVVPRLLDKPPRA